MLPSVELENKIVAKNIPYQGLFELTWRCNLKCIHCYQYSPCSNELTTKEVKDILDQIAEARCFFLSFTGGEPLMRDDFWEIAQYAQKKKFALMLQTNGTLIASPQIARHIRKLNFLRVAISLLGAKAESHDQITGVKGSFQKTIRAVKLLKENGVRVCLITTLMKQNFAEWREIGKLADRLGVDSGISPVIFPKSDGDQSPLQFRIDDEDLMELYSLRCDLLWKKESAEEIKPLNLLCSYGRTTFCISPLGDIYPCVAVPLTVGNLRDKSFHDIWSNSPKLAEIRSTTISDIKVCNQCTLSSYCFRCTGLVYLEEGNLLGCSQECHRMTKITKEVIENEEEIPEA